MSLEYINIIRSLTKQIVENLVLGNFEKIANDKIKVEDIKQRISEYDGKLTTPPEIDYANLEITKFGSEPYIYIIDYDLWIDSNKSDLTLTTIVDVEKQKIKVSDLHTL